MAVSEERTTDRALIGAVIVLLAAVTLLFLAALFNLKWADPVGSLLAVGAALAGGSFILMQTNASKRQAERDRAQKFLAARATMSLTLSHVTSYAKNCARKLEEIYATRSGAILEKVPSLGPFPQFPAQAITEFRTLVEYGPVDIGEAVATLLLQIQTQRARLDSVQEWNDGTGHDPCLIAAELEQYIIDAVEVYMRAGHLFDYARFERDRPHTLTAVAMQSGYRQLFSDDPSDALADRLKRWGPRFEAKFEKI